MELEILKEMSDSRVGIGKTNKKENEFINQNFRDRNLIEIKRCVFGFVRIAVWDT